MKKYISLLCSLLLLPAMLLPASGFSSFADEKTLVTDKTTYTEGEDILITATGSGEDWVGIYKKGEELDPNADGGVTSIRWYYVAKEGNKSGSAKNIFDSEYVNRNELAGLPAGEYTVYLCENDSYNVLAKVDITVKEDTTVQTVPEAPSKVTYDRTGTFVGVADGKLTITAGEETLPDSYKAYWGNKNGPLTDYTAFAPIKCTGAVTEYDMVANTLIPTTADRILVYAVRRNKTSEKAAEVMLPEGAGDYDFGSPLYEMQVLSDIHLYADQNHIHNKHFAMALADIKKLSPNSIGIFINGDVADNGEPAQYRAFQQLIKNAGDGLPGVYCAVGNHDLGAHADKPYDQQLKYFLQYTEPGVDSVYYDMWLGGAHFIFLGSETVGLNATLSPTQLNWFKEKLDEDRDENRPTYVFLHQGLIDTVAGTFAYQKWHGINQSKQFAKILKDYPEVILFSGHSHWEMDSFRTMKERDEKLPTIFNTASGGYLWNDDSMATNEGIEGSQGYYIYAYGDKVLVRGRDFVNGQWISSAQFLVEYEQSGGDDPEVDVPGTQPPAESTGTDADSSNPPQTTPGTAGTQSPTDDTDTAAPAEETSKFPTGLVVGLAVGAVAIAGAAVAVIMTKKRKSGH